MKTRLILVVPMKIRPDTSPLSYLLRKADENPEDVPKLEWEGTTLKVAVDLPMNDGMEELGELLSYLRPYTTPTENLIGYHRREDQPTPTLIWFKDGKFTFEET